MESLQEIDAKRINKMSTERLRATVLSNLGLVEVTAEQVAQMSRSALLDMVAKMHLMLRERAEDPLAEDPFTLAAAEGDAAELEQESAVAL